MQNRAKFLSFNDLEIMISVEGKATHKHPFYQSTVVLLYIKRGVLHLEIDQEQQDIERGNFVLINRDTHGFIHKTWTAEEQSAQIFAFAFHQEFVKGVGQHVKAKALNGSSLPVAPFYILPPNPILGGFFDSIINYLEEEQHLDTQLVELKTMEAMVGIHRFHPECYALFQQDFDARKINLRRFVEANYMYNLPLSKLAELSERSLSTFCREFKSIFNETPHRWIRRRRLLKARELLTSTNRRPVDFYLELGFESLAHFSRAFKKEFGETLTDFRKNHVSRLA